MYFLDFFFPFFGLVLIAAFLGGVVVYSLLYNQLEKPITSGIVIGKIEPGQRFQSPIHDISEPGSKFTSQTTYVVNLGWRLLVKSNDGRIHGIEVEKKDLWELADICDYVDLKTNSATRFDLSDYGDSYFGDEPNEN